jgi:hypothetical protein
MRTKHDNGSCGVDCICNISKNEPRISAWNLICSYWSGFRKHFDVEQIIFVQYNLIAFALINDIIGDYFV